MKVVDGDSVDNEDQGYNDREDEQLGMKDGKGLVKSNLCMIAEMIHVETSVIDTADI